ncbi:hypothetical protein JCM10908_007200 [Rhodotorula pacifica]|uniref:uncharacterized protein n=1 Tax=Rhodotorula pacifica TaxID=1495444 RepID=UPI00317E6642
MSARSGRSRSTTVVGDSPFIDTSASAAVSATSTTASWSPSLGSLFEQRSATSRETTPSDNEARSTMGRSTPAESTRMARKRVGGASDWLVIVKPPAKLPHSPPPPRASAFASAYGPPERFSDGILMPLQSTLSSQVALIAREYGLPSVAGICVYVDVSYGAPQRDLDLVRVTDDTWPLLWKPFGERSANAMPALRKGIFSPCASGLASPQWLTLLTLAIAGRISFDIDLRRARWFADWSSSSTSEAHGQPNSPKPWAQPRSNSSFSYLPPTPSAYAVDSRGESVASSPKRRSSSAEADDAFLFAENSTKPVPSTSTPPSPRHQLRSPSELLSVRRSSLTGASSPGIDWTEQLNQLRTIRERDLVEGIEHPSQIGSLDETESLGQIYAALTHTKIDEDGAASPSIQRLAIDPASSTSDQGDKKAVPKNASPPSSDTRWHTAGLYDPLYRVTLSQPTSIDDKLAMQNDPQEVSDGEDLAAELFESYSTASQIPGTTSAARAEIELPAFAFVPAGDLSQPLDFPQATRHRTRDRDTPSSPFELAHHSPLPSPTIRPSPSPSLSGSSYESHFFVPLPPLPTMASQDAITKTGSAASSAYFEDPDFSDDDDDEAPISVPYGSRVRAGSPLGGDDEEESQSDGGFSPPDFDEGDSECQVFDHLTSFDIPKIGEGEGSASCRDEDLRSSVSYF